MRVTTSRATEEDLVRFALLNATLRIELTGNGELSVSPPTGGWSARCETELLVQLHAWAKRTGFGVAFGAQGTFRLPDGSIRSPDVAVVKQARYDALTVQEQNGFLPLSPDIVVEVQSATDDRRSLTDKLALFRAHGSSITVLFDPVGHVEVSDSFGSTQYQSPSRLDITVAGAAQPLVLELIDLYRRS